MFTLHCSVFLSNIVTYRVPTQQIMETFLLLRTNQRIVYLQSYRADNAIYWGFSRLTINSAANWPHTSVNAVVLYIFVFLPEYVTILHIPCISRALTMVNKGSLSVPYQADSRNKTSAYCIGRKIPHQLYGEKNIVRQPYVFLCYISRNMIIRCYFAQWRVDIKNCEGIRQGCHNAGRWRSDPTGSHKKGPALRPYFKLTNQH